ncbi:EamA family transporter [Campylobacter concisus]|nr:EamA family transporter [Campylobacter concisus]
MTTVLFCPVCFKEIQTSNAYQVALVDKFSVVLAIILAVIFLGERLNLKEILAICLIISGVVLLIFK